MDFYLSIVATTRNDNHGGDLMARTTAFVQGVFDQAKKWDVSVELILVEWNPPKNRPLLKEDLPQPDKDTPVSIKYIIVPEELHMQYSTGNRIPLFQMIAKNVGIRRAKGAFILCTNIDILFSDECFKIFKQQKLEKGKYYRTNRCDVPKEILEYDTLEEQLQYASKNVITRLGKSKGHETLDLPHFMYNFTHTAVLLNTLVFKIWKWIYPDAFAHFRVDFDACGDFTLMSKEDWMDIEGYVELDMYSIHIDSMALWAANALGKEQVIFPYEAPVYHIYHEDGWESKDPIRTIKFLEGKPSLDYSIVYKAGMEIIRQKRSWEMNPPNWGFADQDLETYVFAPYKEKEKVY